MAYFIDFSILKRNPNYRLLYIGQFMSFIGTMVTATALPFQIYEETHSTLVVGLLSLCQLLPLLLTALLGGALADHYSRRNILLISESLLAMGCILLILNAISDVPRVWAIFLVAILMSGLIGLHRPALDSIVRQLVKQEEFSQAAVLSSFMSSSCMIIAPAIAGIIIAQFGVVIIFLVDFISFLISLLSIFMIANITKPNLTNYVSVWSTVKSGIYYTLSRQELAGTYIVDFVAMVFGMPMALFPAIAAAHGGAIYLGLLYAAPSLGALIISLAGGWTKNIKRHGLAIIYSVLGWGIAITCFGIFYDVYLALIFLVFAGGFDALSTIFRSTMWNEIIPNEYRGRLAGIAMIGCLSGPRLGNTEAALVATAFGISASIISGGIFCIIGVGCCCYLLPKFIKHHSDSDT